MLSKLFEFVTEKELVERLKNLGLEYEFLGGGKICFLDRELNDSGICIYFDEKGNVYKAVAETDYIGDREKFRQFLKAIRQKYGLGKDVDVEVKVRDFVWLDEIESRLVGKPVIRRLGRECTFDDELDAEVCFDLERKYGRNAIRRVKVKTKFLGGKEKFRQFLEKLRRKYGLPRMVNIDVITVPEEKLRETKTFYE